MTSTTATERTRVRTYGGWRRTRGLGLFGLGPTATLLVLGLLIAPMLAAAASLRLGGVVSIPCVIAIALIGTRIDGVTIGSVIERRLRWMWASARGYRTFRSGAVVDHDRAWLLPGPLAATRLLSVDDGRGGTFGLVWDRRTGLMTATLRCAASSTWLVNSEEADGWVANWHSWLASLGYLPMVRWVAVTVDTAPEPGTTLQDNVFARIDPKAPDDVRAMVTELVKRSPAASADIETRVSVTFDPAASSQPMENPQDRFTEVSRQLVGLESALATCGVTVLGRASAADLAGTVRVAYDPERRGDVDRLLAASSTEELLAWADAGPVAADDRWDAYNHDSGQSVSWGWHEAPRQQVTSAILTRLMSPGRFSKRVTVLYRPLAAGQAARVLEEQVNAAAFRDAYRRAQKRDETARDVADRERALRAAREEAEGAGVVVMSIYITATVTDQAQLPAAIADVEARADQSKIRLRRLYGGQAAGFMTTLPVGVCPPHLAGRWHR